MVPKGCYFLTKEYILLFHKIMHQGLLYNAALFQMAHSTWFQGYVSVDLALYLMSGTMPQAIGPVNLGFIFHTIAPISAISQVILIFSRFWSIIMLLYDNSRRYVLYDEFHILPCDLLSRSLFLIFHWFMGLLFFHNQRSVF